MNDTANKIKFIGTGSGKVSLKRFHSSFLITVPGYNLLVDAGDGISKAILAAEIAFNSIDGIIFTHLHPDHFTGLGALIVQMKMNIREKPLDIFYHEDLGEVVPDFLLNTYLFSEKIPFVRFKTFKHFKSFSVSESIKITAAQNTHLDEYKAYDKSGKLAFPSNSLLFEVEGKNIFYTGDIGSPADLKLFENFKIDTLVSEITHITFTELIEAVSGRELNKIILTHISDENELELTLLLEKFRYSEISKIVLAYDGMTDDI